MKAVTLLHTFMLLQFHNGQRIAEHVACDAGIGHFAHTGSPDLVHDIIIGLVLVAMHV